MTNKKGIAPVGWIILGTPILVMIYFLPFALIMGESYLFSGKETADIRYLVLWDRLTVSSTTTTEFFFQSIGLSPGMIYPDFLFNDRLMRAPALNGKVTFTPEYGAELLNDVDLNFVFDLE